MLLARRVGKRVGVHRIEAEAERRALLLKRGKIADLVPGNVQRDGRRRPGQLLDDGAILELVEDIAWLPLAGETGKARAAGADTPGGDGDAIGGDLALDLVNVDPAAVESLTKAFIIPAQCSETAFVLGLDRRLADHHRCHQTLLDQRVKDWALPASTLMMLPVDFADMSEARK
ncbi:hypothetical protein D9M68_577680 [compost metagenome]